MTRHRLAVTALVLLTASVPALLGQTTKFVVSSKTWWQDTGVDIRVGDTVSITATGEVKYNPAGDAATPDGNGGQSVLNPDGTCTWLLCGQGNPQWALLGRIGAPDNPNLADIKNGFTVGSRYSQKATRAGRLYLGFNDGFISADRRDMLPRGIGNNFGSFDVVITITRPK